MKSVMYTYSSEPWTLFKPPSFLSNTNKIHRIGLWPLIDYHYIQVTQIYIKSTIFYV